MGAPFRWRSWETALGPDLASVSPWLVPVEQLASAVACEDPSRRHGRYRVVEHADGTFTGVCDEGRCERREFTKAELVQYQPNFGRLRQELARLLGAIHDRRPPGWSSLIPIGYLAMGKENIGVQLAGGLDPESLQRSLNRLWMDGSQRQVVVFASALSLTEALNSFIGKAGWRTFCMESNFVLNSHRLAWSEEGLSAWKHLLSDLGDTPREPFPAIEGLRWQDLILRFNDGHTLAVKGGGFSGRFTYADMRMEDKRTKGPDKQWELLRDFAAEMGSLDWSSAKASDRNKKRKERLAASLKAFFHIADEPFVYNGDTRGWEAVFNIEPE